MKRIITCILLVPLTLVNYSQIIADHTIVDRFDDIPQFYLDEVKKMWLSYAGQSHAMGLLWGLAELGNTYPAYDVSVLYSGTPEGATSSHLRASAATWGSYLNPTGWYYATGEEEWFTNPTGRSRIKSGITYCNTNNLDISAIGFGWCWDQMLDSDLGGGVTTSTDPVYGCHWYGMSTYSPSGWMYPAWGIDAGDFSVTNNVVSMDTYLATTQEYIDYCQTNGYNTKVFFTTGPVDNYEGRILNEALYQGHLKNQHIRDYVNAEPDRILFDYADILCYDDDGTPTNLIWNGRSFPGITAKNAFPIHMGHISDAGNIRLAKAMWWMLARIAGWNGNTTRIDDDKEIPYLFSIVSESETLSIQMLEPDHVGTVNLYSLHGAILDSKQIKDDLCVFNTRSISPGIYIIIVKTDNGLQSQKIVKL